MRSAIRKCVRSSTGGASCGRSSTSDSAYESDVMHVPFVDLKAQHAPLAAEIDAAVHAVFERGDFVMGAAVDLFEAEYAALIGTRHAIAVGTGLAAIEI